MNVNLSINPDVACISRPIGTSQVDPNRKLRVVCYNPTLTVPKAGSKPREMGLIAHSPINRSPMSCDTLSNTS
jgi:hypothetical protein